MPGRASVGVLRAFEVVVDWRCAVYWLWCAGARGCGRMASQIMERVGGVAVFEVEVEEEG